MVNRKYYLEALAKVHNLPFDRLRANGLRLKSLTFPVRGELVEPQKNTFARGSLVFKFIPRSSYLILFLLLLCSSVSHAADIRLLTNKDYFPALEDKIRNARQEILISVYIFRTTESRKNLARKLRDSLISAAGRGVKVTVLLEKEDGTRRGSSLNEDNAYTAQILSKGKVTVYFDEPGTTTHTKLAVIDNRFVFIGSHNFTDSALRRNNEASVMIDSPQIAREAAAFIKGIE